MTRDIITDVSAEVRITLPDGEVVTASTGGGPTAETVGQPTIPALPDPDVDDGPGAGSGSPNGRSASNGAVSGEDALADLPPELMAPETFTDNGSADLPPPNVDQIEAMVAAVEATSDALPPEVVALEALIETDSASLAPPDVSELQPPKRSTRKRK